jgi:lipopolysaccharide biosynthesis glycosyltransferase
MKNKVYIGWDPREAQAYDLAKWSIKQYSENVDIEALKLSEIKHVFNRPIEWKGNQMWCPISQAPQTTEFSTSRFAIPFLHRGWALFVDCDIICKADISKLFTLADDKYAVMAVKHKQKVGTAEVKMVDQASVYYNRKNWSSVMLINCDHPANERLTVDDINAWPGRDLHAFKWLRDEEIGELPEEWNYLVEVSDPEKIENAKILHYTLGGPWIRGWQAKESDRYWLEIRDRFLEI